MISMAGSPGQRAAEPSDTSLPEAAGGPIALIEPGDPIEIDIPGPEVDVAGRGGRPFAEAG